MITFCFTVSNIQSERWGAGVVVCLEQDADLHMAQLMPLPLSGSCFTKIQIGFTFLVPAHLGSNGKRAVKRACVCVSNIQSEHWKHLFWIFSSIFCFSTTFCHERLHHCLFQWQIDNKKQTNPTSFSSVPPLMRKICQLFLIHKHTHKCHMDSRYTLWSRKCGALLLIIQFKSILELIAHT